MTLQQIREMLELLAAIAESLQRIEAALSEFVREKLLEEAAKRQ